MPERAPATQDLEVSDAWRSVIDAYLRELGTRGSSGATLRAYGRDLIELGAWATAREREPGKIVYRDLRGYAAALSDRRLARATVARKLAAARSFHSYLVATGAAAANPADLVPSPKRDQRLPRVLGRDEVAGLLERIPARTPLEVRDRALFELAYSCGLRAEEIVSLDLSDIDFESEEFSRTFWVKGSDRKYVYDVVHPRMMRFLLDGPRPPVEIVDDGCLVLDGRSRWSPEEFRAWIRWADAFFDHWPEHLTARFQEREDLRGIA